ncbi:MAG: hypothetical protein JWO07_51 [Candidatus Saccharibacteria bacterium]|nr:hypothetical protein [Candidatus Saccharibacteria bacterium]
MKQHLGESLEEIDLRVYLCVASGENKVIHYTKNCSRDLFNKLKIAYRFNSDVFNSLKRLENSGCIRREFIQLHPKEVKRKIYSAQTKVVITAIRPPIPPKDESKLVATPPMLATVGVG